MRSPTAAMATDYEIVRLSNGVCSIRARAAGETFHPVIGPAAEAQALYVQQMRLAERLAAHQGEFVVWDVGLGGAANALAVLAAARAIPSSLRLLSFDCTLEPLQFALAHATELGYPRGWEPLLSQLGKQQHAVFQAQAMRVVWEVRVGDFPALLGGPHAASWPKPHLILYDPFSPARNPEMWTLPLFQRLHSLLDPGRPCAMATYSRSTMLRVTWLLAGFFVGTGCATGEKEETTLAATHLELVERPLPPSWLARAKRSTCAEPLQGPHYHRQRISSATWEKLQAHPQFQPLHTGQSGVL
ncbi:MnmC family methyltransferase [Fontisphaera persica]|uniref:MnmC family methyltransferase n=1 Tax=Fontisphaera persica TaxID=2974023 RepID=UPI0024BFC3E9|nr:MnmC family methyltransferase [Fontisphaera persica]WCJ59905.1 MnmC family methyltransferase [Fontisphaera persica]